MNADKRQEILDRVLKLTWEKGGTISWLSERAIRRDSILTYHDVQREFGTVDNLKKEAQAELSRRKQERLASKGEQEVQAKPVVVVPEKREVLEAQEVQPTPEVVAEPEPELKSEKPRRRRKDAVDPEDARADILAVFQRLGRMPSQTEIVGRKVGTKYSYRVYINALGPKDGWCEVLGVQEMAEEPVVAEEPVELKTHEILYPIRVIVPKGIKATVTVSFQVE